MFGLGIGELLLIFVIFLIFFGPDKLPELAKNLGRAMAELRRTVDELKFDMNSTDYRPTPTANKGPEAVPPSDPPAVATLEAPTSTPTESQAGAATADAEKPAPPTEIDTKQQA